MSAVSLDADPAARIREVDWPAVTAEIDAYGCGLTPQILGAAECRRISGLYDEAYPRPRLPRRGLTGPARVAG